MLGLLEKIVNQSKSSDQDSEFLSMALEAIGHLCWNEVCFSFMMCCSCNDFKQIFWQVLDVNVAWKMVYGKLGKDDRYMQY